MNDWFDISDYATALYTQNEMHVENNCGFNFWREQSRSVLTELQRIERTMTTDHEPAEIRSPSPTFHSFENSYSDKNDSSLILFGDEGLHLDSPTKITATHVPSFPLVLDSSCCSQSPNSSLPLFYKDSPNSSLQLFCADCRFAGN